MAEFICWNLNRWESEAEALSEPEFGQHCIGCYDAVHAACVFRESNSMDYEEEDEIPVLVQQVEDGVEPRKYVGDPVVVDVTREAVPVFSGEIRVKGGASDD